MTTFLFETITAAQAATYSAGADTLVFSNPTSSGAKMTVIYNAGTPLAPPSVTLIDNADGKTVTFGTGIFGEGETANGSIIFQDGSNLVIGGAGGDATPIVTANNDGMFGGAGDDTLN